MNKVSPFFRCAIGALFLFTFALAACGPNQAEIDERERVAALERQAAATKRELELIREAEARSLRQAEADRRVNDIARTAVRTSQLTDRSGCRIIPASLVENPAATEFRDRMVVRYPAACEKQVSAYKVERQRVAAAERAKGARAARVAAANSANKRVAQRN